MGCEYGIQICKEVLHFLCTEQPLETRIEHAFSEIGIIKYSDDSHSDVSLQHFNDIQTLKENYRSISESKLSFGKNGFLTNNKEKELSALSRKLVDLCVEIIQYNVESGN